MKYERKSGGRYYAVDEYGHRQAVSMGMGTEVTDGILEGVPIVLKMFVPLYRLFYRLSVKLRNAILTEEELAVQLEKDAKRNWNYGNGFIGSLIIIVVLGTLAEWNVILVVISLARRGIMKIMDMWKNRASMQGEE